MPAASVSPIDPRLGQFSRWKAAVADVAESSGLVAVLEQVPDPRDARGRRYRLSSLLAVALCAVATGARSFYAIADWVGGVSPEVLKRLGIRFRVPSESAIRLAIGRVDGGVLDRVLGAHLAATATPPGQRLQVALDGKTVRGARNGDTVAPHLVAAITHDGATVLGQRRIDSKSNEIPAVRRLLATIDVGGAVVTVDAMHTQKATARYLRERCKADYVMTVKANQPRPARPGEIPALGAGPGRLGGTRTARARARGAAQLQDRHRGPGLGVSLRQAGRPNHPPPTSTRHPDVERGSGLRDLLGARRGSTCPAADRVDPWALEHREQAALNC